MVGWLWTVAAPVYIYLVYVVCFIFILRRVEGEKHAHALLACIQQYIFLMKLVFTAVLYCRGSCCCTEAGICMLRRFQRVDSHGWIVSSIAQADCTV